MNQTTLNKYFAIGIGIVALLICIYLFALGEGPLVSILIPCALAGLAYFMVQNHFRQKNPILPNESQVYLYTELAEYNPALLKAIREEASASGELYANDLKRIRAKYAASINRTSLQALIDENTEESHEKLTVYNYSLEVLDAVINECFGSR